MPPRRPHPFLDAGLPKKKTSIDKKPVSKSVPTKAKSLDAGAHTETKKAAGDVTKTPAAAKGTSRAGSGSGTASAGVSSVAKRRSSKNRDSTGSVTKTSPPSSGAVSTATRRGSAPAGSSDRRSNISPPRATVSMPKGSSSVRDGSRSPRLRTKKTTTTASTHTMQRASSERKAEPKAVPVPMEWTHEYGAHALMFKKARDVSAEHSPANIRRATGQPASASKAVVIRRAAVGSSTKGDHKRASSSSSRSRDGSTTTTRPRSRSTPPSYTNADARSTDRRSAAKGVGTDGGGGSGSRHSGEDAAGGLSVVSSGRRGGALGSASSTSSASGAVPPRSMPRKWVERPSSRPGSRDAPPEQLDAAILRFGLFRGVFNLEPNINGVRGILIDEEFNMADSYLGQYTFKVRGPGMMGPELKEHGVPPDGERSYLTGGGDSVVDLRPNKEYWVEVVPCGDDAVIMQKIDLVESEIARLTTADAVARAAVCASLSPPRSKASRASSRHSDSDPYGVSSYGRDGAVSAPASTPGYPGSDGTYSRSGIDSTTTSEDDGRSSAFSPSPTPSPLSPLAEEPYGSVADDDTTEDTHTVDTDGTSSDKSRLLCALSMPLPSLPSASSIDSLPSLPGGGGGGAESPRALERRVSDAENRLKELRRQALQRKLSDREAEIAALEQELQN
eukprot:m.187698 g.187698  ORF g.187698 m.187698 type:complete len:674 (+) comp17170_c0_seq1:294-2315(+)